jgi:arginyl-tRNA synthetase
MLEKIIQKIVIELFALEQVDFAVDYAKEEKFGDYATNVAMILAKKVGKNPMEIAETLKKELSSLEELSSFLSSFLSKIEIVAPGYINFYLSEKFLQDKVAEINSAKENFGTGEKRNGKTMVEYSQPNTHKEFHIGHLRNVFIGSAMVNILKKGGQDVISANYIGDTGTHIAKCLWGMTKFYKDTNLDAIENKAEFLGKVYAEAVAAIGDKPEYEDEFKQLQKRFDAGDKQLVELWEKTKQWSLDEFQEIYQELGVEFDIYFWESEEEQAGKKMVVDLMKQDFIKESQGAIIADLEDYNLGILVLIRKDGGILYGLKDIPLAIKKFSEYGIDRSIIVVDIRQGLYFKQIFKILELIGFKEKMQHIGYDFVSLKGSETMSSRKGNIIPAKFLMEKMIEKVREKFPETKIEKEVGLGALRFYMLKYSAQSKIEFDMGEAIRLDGATGPYVQYAHARICSILRKAQETNANLVSTDNNSLSLLVHEKEMSLIKELNKFPELVAEVSESYEVHKLPYFAIKLADKFHSFYNACKVIDEENLELTKARLSLIIATRIVLAETLDLIGVSVPEKM